jgi:hypothetical protein
MKHRLLSVIILSLVCVVALLIVRGGAAQARGLEQPQSPTDCSPSIVVTNANDSGAGSLRQAIADVCPGGTIYFDHDMTITLASQLVITKALTIDGMELAVTVSGNSATRVFVIEHVSQSVVLKRLTIANGWAGTFPGGGIHNNFSNLTVDSCLLTGNATHASGGAIYDNGRLAVVNSTLTGNSAGQGGAIYSNSQFTGLFLVDSTITRNSGNYGGGVSNLDAMYSATAINTIIAHQMAGTNCHAWFDDSSHNLSNTSSCGPDFTQSDAILLGALGDYGGVTWTIPVLPGSAAVDMGSECSVISLFCSTSDQRGFPNVGAQDIGAFESQGFSLTIAGGNDQSAVVNTAFATPLSVNITPMQPGEPVNGGVVTFAGPGSGASINPSSGIRATIEGGNVSQNVSANGIAGSYVVTATASGASNVFFSLTNNKYDTTTSVASAPNPSTYGQMVTFTATVTSTVGTPIGSVQFYIAGSPFGSPIALSGSTALTTTSTLSAASHPITATYSGDAIHSRSTATVLTQVVTKANTTTSVASSLNPSIYSQAVTFTATVTSTMGSPIGNVQFYADGSPFGSPVTLSGGKAATTTSALSAASHPITTTYSGSPNYNGSTSATLTQVVNCLNLITVTNAANSGAGSLRQAVADVCPGGSITFGGDYTITLASELPINRGLSIDGGSHRVIVSGNHATRVFSVTAGPVTLAHLTIADGNVQTSDCGAFEACGGGILVRNSGLVVTVTNSILSGNWAAARGGGIFNFGTLIVLSSTLVNNSASGAGGGLYNTAVATVQSSTFWGNSANIGGGVSNQQGMTIQNSTFYSNSANYSGGISHVNGTLTLKNSTISGNSASNTGGGLGTYGNLNLTQTIIANSLSGGDCYKGSGTIAINDHNLIGVTGSNACGLTNGAGGSLIGVDPLLSPLGNYGGSTATFALLPGSPAINAGGATCPATDQRGKGRVGACDIGACESQGFTLAKSGGDNQAAVVNTAFALPLSVTLSETGGSGLPGALITFTAPISGASMVAPTLVTTMTNTSGVAAIAIQANATPGTYTIVAQGIGVADVLFNLKNLIKMYLPLILKY